MLDLKRIREDPEAIRKGAAAKGEECDIDGILELDAAMGGRAMGDPGGAAAGVVGQHLVHHLC